jgi:hypothetical protein
MKLISTILISCFLLCAFLLAPAVCQSPQAQAGSPQATAPQAATINPVNVKALTAGKEKLIASYKDNKQLQPVMLSWSPDDSTLFVYAEQLKHVQEKSVKTLSKADFSIPAAGGEFKEEEGRQAWVKEYWDRKSAQVSQDGAQIKRETSGRMEEVYNLAGKTVGRPWYYLVRRQDALGKQLSEFSGGEPGSPGRSVGDTSSAPELHLFYPGMTYSWSPPGGKAIVYYDDFKVQVMSENGKEKKKIASGDLYLPAWSNDGKKVACIRVNNRGNVGLWELYVIELSGVEALEQK